MNRSKGCKRLTSFLQKAYELVNDASNAAIVSWTPDGCAFAIKSIPDFTESILPRYFKHSNFASFVRQLNMYDFHKLRQVEGQHVFSHPFFLRGKRKLLKQIRRKTAEASLETETNSLLSRSDCESLLAKVQELQREHELLEETVATLRSENRDMAIHNQDLVVELNAYKEREERLEKLLKRFSGQLRSIALGGVLGDMQDADDLLMLGEEAQTSELEEPVKRLTDSSLDSLKSEYQESQRDINPDSVTLPPEDADMDAELEKLLEPRA